MSWEEYVRRVRGSAHHPFRESLRLLRTAQSWFAGTPWFSRLPVESRKAIAGFIGERDKARSAELGQGWGWFGSMSGAGAFTNRVIENDRSLAQAVDLVPLRGEVTREHYQRFVDAFLRAFRDAARVGRVPSASRLLAMKRPDVFLCISRPNAVGAADMMGFAKSTLTLENYWERVVEVIRASEWYSIDKPTGRDGELWEFRAAMLDAILYDPNDQ